MRVINGCCCCASVELSNDTNEDSLHYFMRVTNHYYLCLAKHTPDLSSRHDMRFPIISDSGANWHIFNYSSFFTDLQLASGQVVLGDGITSVPIHGIGTISLRIN